MLILNQMIKEMDHHVTSIHLSYESEMMPGGIFILDGHNSPPADHIYIAGSDALICSITNQYVPAPATVFLAKNAQIPAEKIKNLNIITTDLELPVLYNALFFSLQRIQQSDEFTARVAFTDFLTNISSNKNIECESIKKMILSLPLPVSEQRFYFIIIGFNQGASLLAETDRIFVQLSSVFDNCNMGIFDKKVVILYQADTPDNKVPDHVRGKLAAFLAAKDGYAVISNGIRKITSIHTVFLIAKRLSEITPKFQNPDSTRIFDQEEYGIYYVIDSSRKQFQENFGHDDILFLTHPGILALIRHDAIHGSNLLRVLHCYLVNNQNLTKTSKQMFMHRNTTLNKIRKIQDIINVDLNNPDIQTKLLFSFYIIKYLEHFRKKPVEVLLTSNDKANQL